MIHQCQEDHDVVLYVCVMIILPHNLWHFMMVIRGTTVFLCRVQYIDVRTSLVATFD